MGQTLTDRQSIAAAAVVANVMANKQFAILPYNALVTIGMTGSVASAFVTITLGRQALVTDQEINDTNAAVRKFDDQLVSEFAAQGDQVVIAVRNANAAANVVRTIVWLEQI